MIRILVICVCSIFLSSCSEQLHYSSSVDFTNSVWQFENPAVFNFDITDNSDKYNLFLDIDHSNNYPFENLYLRIKTEFPDKSIAIDTLSIEMVNNQGKWIGDCGSENCDLKVFLQEKTKFKESGSHKIDIEQFTRESDLMGIKSLSFSVGYWSE